MAASKVQGGLSVTPVPNSSLVWISFDSPNPQWAQRVADGVADSFISSNLERRYGATAYARNFLKERLDELAIKLEESGKSIGRLRGKEGDHYLGRWQTLIGRFRLGRTKHGLAKSCDRAN